MNHSECVRQILEERGMVRARDLTATGVPLVYLKRLVDAGQLVRLARGLYQRPDRVGEDADHDLAKAVRLVPNGVVSLLSALRHHKLTTQLPHTVWMTIPHKARTPDKQRIRLEVIRATGEVMTAGIEHFRVEGVDVPVYGIAKTIADCFKHRRQVGEDVAIEALRDALKQQRTTVDDLMTFAAINRVTGRIEPYIRAMQ